MSSNYKHMYQKVKLMLEKYQDEIVPGLRRLLEERVEVVRCKDCMWYKRGIVFKDSMFCFRPNELGDTVVRGFNEYDFCSYGERREDND